MAKIINFLDREPVAEKVICNCCAKEIKDFDIFSLTTTFGYGSKRDLDILELKLCKSCLDKLTDRLLKRCKISPVIEWNGDPVQPYDARWMELHPPTGTYSVDGLL